MTLYSTIVIVMALGALIHAICRPRDDGRMHPTSPPGQPSANPFLKVGHD